MRITRSLIVALLMGFLLVFFTKPASAATLLPGFEDQLVTSVGSPTSLAFTPDDRMLLTSQSGQLRVLDENGALLQSPALDLAAEICANPVSTKGLLGVTVDPSFATNNYIYLYYTFNKTGDCANSSVNRVARYALSSDNVATFDRILVDNVPAGGHNGGDLHFGKDGYLYVSTGDGQCDYAGDSRCGGKNDASRDQHALIGKILRITRDGSIPADNPYQGADSARCNETGLTDPGKKCQETFAWGLRNPFRMAFDPNVAGTRFFINDVGELAWEEIDEGQAGADYGWNICEGNHDNPASDGSAPCNVPPYTAPTHEYDHTTGCASITGGAFVPKGIWPTEYDGSYLFGDYVCNKIFTLTPKDDGGFTSAEFASGLAEGGPIAMSFGPYGTNQALYYTTYANGGEVHRIAATETNDTVKPSGTVLINGGAARTRRAAVRLTLSATDEGGSGVGAMRFSNDGSSWSAWEPYATSKAWTLSSDRGTKTVYVQFRDEAGNVSDVASDTIRRVRRH